MATKKKTIDPNPTADEKKLIQDYLHASTLENEWKKKKEEAQQKLNESLLPRLPQDQAIEVPDLCVKLTIRNSPGKLLKGGKSFSDLTDKIKELVMINAPGICKKSVPDIPAIKDALAANEATVMTWMKANSLEVETGTAVNIKRLA